MVRDFEYSDLSILVVDSNLHNLGLTRSMLLTLGVSGTSAATGAHSALEQFSVTTHDLAIVDMDFNDCICGLEVVQIVRAGDNIVNPSIPIIMISARPALKQILAARDAGVNEFLRRPFSVAELSERITASMQDPRPYIRSTDYFGPDRRRPGNEDYEGPERRLALLEPEISDEPVLDPDVDELILEFD